MDATILRFLSNLAVTENLNMRFIDVVIAYLSKSLDSDIYIRIYEGFKISEANYSKSHGIYLIKLQRFLYGFKQHERM